MATITKTVLSIMAQVTQKELDRLAERLNEALGITDERKQYAIGYAYGSPRLEKNMGSVDISPRLTKGKLHVWIHAYIGGIYAERGAKDHKQPTRTNKMKDTLTQKITTTTKMDALRATDEWARQSEKEAIQLARLQMAHGLIK